MWNQKNFVKLWQINEISASFSSFAFISPKFAQILKYFAQSSDCMIRPVECWDPGIQGSWICVSCLYFFVNYFDEILLYGNLTENTFWTLWKQLEGSVKILDELKLTHWFEMLMI